MNSIEIENKVFVKYLDSKEIKEIVLSLAKRINKDYEGKEVTFLVVLNGAFMFATDILKEIDVQKIKAKVSFVKLASYCGTLSQGRVKQLIGVNEELKGKNIIILEDIVETGQSMQSLLSILKDKEAASIDICSLVFKPKAFEEDFN